MIKFHTHIEHSNRAKEKPPGPIQIVAHMATLGLLGSYVLLFVIGDVGWVVATLGLVAFGVWITTPQGVWVSLAVAVWVGACGLGQFLYRPAPPIAQS